MKSLGGVALATGLMLCFLAACSDSAREASKANIRNVMEMQAAAWNRGDIPAFMTGYWKSDALRFASGSTVTSGWQATLDRYLARYDSPDKMGTLTFSDLDVDMVAEDAAVVFGKWHLMRPEAGDIGGLFTLVFKRIGGNWVIVHDHTSAAE